MESVSPKPSLGLLLSKESERVWEFVRKDLDVRSAPKPEINEVEDDEYLALFASLSPEEVNNVIDQHLGITKDNPDGYDDEDFPLELRDLPPDGYLFCPVFLPFDDNGDGKSMLSDFEYRDWVNNGTLIRNMIVEPTDHLTSGFTENMGYYYDFLPKILKKDVEDGGCCFIIDYPQSDMTYENRAWLITKYRKALENMRKILNQRMFDSDGNRSTNKTS